MIELKPNQINNYFISFLKEPCLNKTFSEEGIKAFSKNYILFIPKNKKVINTLKKLIKINSHIFPQYNIFSNFYYYKKEGILYSKIPSQKTLEIKLLHSLRTSLQEIKNNQLWYPSLKEYIQKDKYNTFKFFPDKYQEWIINNLDFFEDEVIHSDLFSSNLIWQNNRLKVIDIEWTCLGSRLHDFFSLSQRYEEVTLKSSKEYLAWLIHQTYREAQFNKMTPNYKPNLLRLFK